LSTIQPPVVSNLQARSAIVAWSPPAALSELLAYVASRRSENQTSATDVAVGDKDKEEGEDGVKDGESKSPKGKKNSGRKRKDGGDKEDGGDNEEEEVKKEKFSAKIVELASEMDLKDLRYNVMLSDKGPDDRHFRSIYSGTSSDCHLTDLRPATEYHIW
jgi:hypothetical protein